MSTKILIGQAELQALIAGKPEIEIQLLEKAVPQLAGLIARKVEEKAGKVGDIVQQAVNRQLNDIGNKYGNMNGATRAIITSLIKEELDKYGRSLVLQSINEHLRPELKKEFEAFRKDALRSLEISEADLKDRINNHAKIAAEREVLALMRGMGAKETQS